MLAYYRKTSNLALFFMNLLVQRVFRVNGKTNWMVHYTSQVIAPQKIQIGRNVERSFARSGNCYIQGLNGIIMEDNVLFAPGVKIISSNHGFENHKEIVHADPKHIGENTWIGANSILLPGVQIGKNCIVGAGSVVTKSFDNNSIIAGNPAKVIKMKPND